MSYQRKKVCITPSSLLKSRTRLFRALESFFPVDFVEWKGQKCHQKIDALLTFMVDQQEKPRLGLFQIPVLVFTAFKNMPEATTVNQITFADTEVLDLRLRGRCLVDRSRPQVSTLTIEDADIILASYGGVPIWAYRPTSVDAGIQWTSLMPDELGENEILSQHFNGTRFIQILPLFHFLQHLTADIAWNPPLMRACIMIDDPNLHWPSYGHVRFRELASHADRHGYHVAFATIPLDGWYAHPEAVSIFHAQSGQLSLLIHGNNHTKRELIDIYTPEQETALLAQSLRRIRKLEEQTNLHVARVMAAPHGACTERMMSRMRQLGYEAACISQGSVQAWNPDRRWSFSSFLEIAEIMGGGLPVLPRFRLNEDCLTSIIVAAMLNQPIIPVAHQDVMSNSLELLADVSQTIASLGNVKWTNMTDLARSNFLTRQEGSLLRIRTYSRHIAFTVPEGIRRVQIERAWDNEDGLYSLRNVATRKDNPIESCTACRVVQFEVQAGESLAVEMQPSDLINCQEVPPSPIRVWPILRRLLAEARDRAAPWTGRPVSSAHLPWS